MGLVNQRAFLPFLCLCRGSEANRISYSTSAKQLLEMPILYLPGIKSTQADSTGNLTSAFQALPVAEDWFPTSEQLSTAKWLYTLLNN